MKRKIERFVASKNIDGVEKLYDEQGRFLIADDIEGTLKAVRATSGGRKDSNKDKKVTKKGASAKTSGSSCASASKASVSAENNAAAAASSSIHYPNMTVMVEGIDINAIDSQVAGGVVHLAASDELEASAAFDIDNVLEEINSATGGNPSSLSSPQRPSSPFSTSTIEGLSLFVRNLKGGYVNGTYCSGVARRKLAVDVDLRSRERNLITVLELTPLEVESLPQEVSEIKWKGKEIKSFIASR